MDEALIECLEKKELEYITVKEICKKAGVNRSTFYLHYETIDDLLKECAEYTNDKCFRKYSVELADIGRRLESRETEELIFISPEYLRPYFEFVRENKRLFKVVFSHPASLNTEGTFRQLFANIFSPILDRFHLAERDKAYIIMFYIGGLTSVVKKWLEKDCSDSIEQIIDICMRCILPDGEKGYEMR